MPTNQSMPTDTSDIEAKQDIIISNTATNATEVEQETQTIIQTSLRDVLNELLDEQRLTNKLLTKIYNPE